MGGCFQPRGEGFPMGPEGCRHVGVGTLIEVVDCFHSVDLFAAGARGSLPETVKLHLLSDAAEAAGVLGDPESVGVWGVLECTAYGVPVHCVEQRAG